jgi:hypothetical protein
VTLRSLTFIAVLSFVGVTAAQTPADFQVTPEMLRQVPTFESVLVSAVNQAATRITDRALQVVPESNSARRLVRCQGIRDAWRRRHVLRCGSARYRGHEHVALESISAAATKPGPEPEYAASRHFGVVGRRSVNDDDQPRQGIHRVHTPGDHRSHAGCRHPVAQEGQARRSRRLDPGSLERWPPQAVI